MQQLNALSSDRFKVLAAYAVATAAAVVALLLLSGPPLWLAFGADLVATAVVWMFSVRWNNTSVYDPYWSVAPPLLALFWLASAAGAELRSLMVFALIMVWSVRLTWNWVDRWQGLSDEDWRYVEIRHKTGSWYWPASLVGLQLMPTLLVFAGCLPVAMLMLQPTPGLNLLDGLALLVTALAIAVEAVADNQLRAHRRSGAEGRLRSGLWGWLPNPNYLGEIGFWWGLWLFAVAADPDHWWTGIGAMAITLLFVAYSFPAMRQRVAGNR
jgi:steroid 5-alpha reductase family enzyme